MDRALYTQMSTTPLTIENHAIPGTRNLNLEQFLRNHGGKVVVLKFTAVWCGPCHAIQPYYEQLAQQYAPNMACYTVDVDNWEELAAALAIRNMPTFKFLALVDQKVVQLAEIIGADRNQLAVTMKTTAQQFGGGGAPPQNANVSQPLDRDGIRAELSELQKTLMMAVQRVADLYDTVGHE